MKNIGRVVLSVVAVIGTWVFDITSNVVSPLISGPASVQQLQDTNSGYIEATLSARFINGAGIPVILLLLILAVIWYKPVANVFSSAASEK
jgi:hypothetical protein